MVGCAGLLRELLAPPLFPPPSFPTVSIENLSSSPVIPDIVYRESILVFPLQQLLEHGTFVESTLVSK